MRPAALVELDALLRVALFGMNAPGLAFSALPSG
jgi:hypothetical protein